MRRMCAVFAATLLLCSLAVAQAQSKFMVVSILPLSGALAEYGVAAKNGIELARSQHSELFRNMEFIYDDSKYDTKTALSAHSNYANRASHEILRWRWCRHTLKKNSLPERRIFAFTYSVSIRNYSQETVQLLERHWIIKSAGRQVAEVVGPGVAGVQPVLEHRTTFEYASNVIIHDAFGSMEGSYTFRAESGKYFEVQIPRFDLLYPLTIH